MFAHLVPAGGEGGRCQAEACSHSAHFLWMRCPRRKKRCVFPKLSAQAEPRREALRLAALWKAYAVQALAAVLEIEPRAR